MLYHTRVSRVCHIQKRIERVYQRLYESHRGGVFTPVKALCVLYSMRSTHEYILQRLYIYIIIIRQRACCGSEY